MNPKLNIVARMGLWDPFGGQPVCGRQLGPVLGQLQQRQSVRKRMCLCSLLGSVLLISLSLILGLQLCKSYS